MVLLLCLVGAYSLNNSQLDLWVLVGFGIFGYGLRKLAIDPSPLVVALVLGPMMEKTLRQSLFMARGNVLEVLSRPLTARPADPGGGRPRGAPGGATPAPAVDQRGAGSIGSLKRSRLPKGSITSITRAFQGATSMPGRMNR